MEPPDNLLRDFLGNLKRLMAVEAVAVFGSRGRGDAYHYSDYDIVVVSDELAGLNPLQRRQRLYDAWKSLKAADIFGLTPVELHRMDSPIIWDMLEDGKVLFDKGAWRRAVREFENHKRSGRLTPVPGGWRIAEGPPDPPDERKEG